MHNHKVYTDAVGWFINSFVTVTGKFLVTIGTHLYMFGSPERNFKLKKCIYIYAYIYIYKTESVTPSLDKEPE